MKDIKIIIRNSLIYSILLSFYRSYFANRRSKFGFMHPTAFVRLPTIIKGIENVFLYENTHILSNSLILSTKAKFIMKKNSGAAEGLTVVTGNNYSVPGKFFMDITDNEKPQDLDKNVVVEEDVWIASNVTLLSGVNIGRGAVLGAGSVCRKDVPPYAVVIGNPGKVVGFKFTPEEAFEHEKMLYTAEKRIPLEVLEANYNKYFVNKIKDIKQYLK
jgi:acetyltransferase-like isoleucine patch superfamily enzyme